MKKAELLTPTLSSRIQWLNQFLTAFLFFQGIWLLFLFFYLSPYQYLIWEYGINYYPVYVPLVILIYWLGFKWNALPRWQGGNKKLILSPQIQEAIAILLKEVMEKERMYLQQDLNTQKLASRLDLPQKLLSHVLNDHFKLGFNDFVNQYRVGEVKKRMNDPKYQHLTISGIALDSGFNSAATFQRAFKKFVGMKPSEFRARILGK